MDKMRVLTRDEFVRRIMSDMAKRKREKMKRIKRKENDINGVIMDNHFRICKYLRYH